jgi:hypothetical protein
MEQVRNRKTLIQKIFTCETLARFGTEFLLPSYVKDTL